MLVSRSVAMDIMYLLQVCLWVEGVMVRCSNRVIGWISEWMGTSWVLKLMRRGSRESERASSGLLHCCHQLFLTNGEDRWKLWNVSQRNSFILFAVWSVLLVYHLAVSVTRVGWTWDHMVMAPLQWMQRAQQNEGMWPALMCCCCLTGQE
jgi:hypothetical protein